MQTDLLIFVIVKALLELACFFLFGQAVVYLIAGKGRDRNRIYQVFRVLTGPMTRFARFVTPKVIVDRHIPYLAFLLILWAWMFLVFWLLPELCESGAIDCKPLIERNSQAWSASGSREGASGCDPVLGCQSGHPSVMAGRNG